MQLMGEKAAKVENFGTYLSEVPVTSTDRGLLQLAATVMGHLVRSNVQLTAALVDNEVTPAYDTSPSVIRFNLSMPCRRRSEGLRRDMNCSACICSRRLICNPHSVAKLHFTAIITS